jgi:hypothetical protein
MMATVELTAAAIIAASAVRAAFGRFFGRVLRCEKLVGLGIADCFAGHLLDQSLTCLRWAALAY